MSRRRAGDSHWSGKETRHGASRTGISRAGVGHTPRTRNDRIAEIVRDADVICRQSLAEIIRTPRLAAGHQDSNASLSSIVEAILSIFEGLRIRAIRNPGIDQDMVAEVFRKILIDLLIHTY